MVVCSPEVLVCEFGGVVPVFVRKEVQSFEEGHVALGGREMPELVQPAAIEAFCEFAVGNAGGFRRELAKALISLPWLRVFLMNQRAPLPDGDDGFRGIQPDMELFTEFAWPAYVEVPGLVHACRSFLTERNFVSKYDLENIPERVIYDSKKYIDKINYYSLHCGGRWPKRCSN